MASNSASNPDRTWFEHLSRAPKPSLRLFCFPYAGGTADVYRSWQRWFSPEIDLCLVHLPGRGRRMAETAFTRVKALVNAVAPVIASEIQAPYALYGHSMGALISFELARELVRRHRTGPEHLFVSGRRAPTWPDPDPPTYHLPHDQFIAELKRLKGTPEEVLDHPELMELFLGLLRADFEMVDTYEFEPGSLLSCPITVYGGLSDEHVPAESCRAWSEQTSGVCRTRMVQGDHFFVRKPGQDFVNAFRQDVLNVASVPHVRETK